MFKQLNFAMKYFLTRSALTNDKKVKYINVTIMGLYISTEYYKKFNDFFH